MVRKNILSQYCMKNLMGVFCSNGILSVHYQKMLDYHTSGSRLIPSISSQRFTLDCLMSHKTDPLKSLLGVQRHMEKMYLFLLYVMFYRQIIVLVCSIRFHLNLNALVIKLLLIVLNMKLHPR